LKLRAFIVRLLREPLVHFLLAGAVVFAFMSGRPPDQGERRIVVNEAVVTRLVSRWTMTFRRSPTQAEIDGLIRDYVSDQIYYREGLRLGLDRDDEVVIRRMRLKLLALASSDADVRTPSDAELQALIDANQQRYASEPSLDFEQLYLGPDNAASREVARALLLRLKAGKPAVAAFPQAPIDRRFADVAPSEVAERFGDVFAQTIGNLPTGGWHGPIASGFGLHLVKIDGKRMPKPPRLADIRQRVENDWRSEMTARAEEKSYREMAADYDVVIERAQ
jgi:hypothetical protein